jgi:hypothetical protein
MWNPSTVKNDNYPIIGMNIKKNNRSKSANALSQSSKVSVSIAMLSKIEENY